MTCPAHSLLLSAASGIFISCATASAPAPAQSTPPEPPFRALSARFISEYLRLNPAEATTIGDHSHDGEWPDLSVAGDATARALIDRFRTELKTIPASSLDAQDAIDAQILEHELAAWLFSLDELKRADNNPMLYTTTLSDGLDPLLTRTFAPHEDRMRSLLARLRGLPRVVEVAEKRLGHPPRVHTETAIEQTKGLIHLCDKGLAEDIAKEPALQGDLQVAAQQATAALTAFQAFLQNDLLPRSTGDFRLGRPLFERKLRFALDDDVDIDAIAHDARELLTQTKAEMFETALELWPRIFPKEKPPAANTADEKSAVIKRVLAALGEDRPDNATIVNEASQLLQTATAFVREHDLVRVPDEPCKAIEMPEYKRGFAVAYCESSGPLEKKQETVFAISPTPADWTPERARSFYKEYNRSMLADLTVHEAMPGHFLQAMHANRFKSDVRAVFSSGAFVEGWAVYGEWLMASTGFGGPKVRMQRQKMILRVCANAILDHDIHAGAMDEKGALALMMNEGFQEEGEAAGKWRRARLSSAQLTTYYYGFSQLLRLRQQLQSAPGFTERAYHDKLLSFGAPAIRHIRTLMLAPAP
jgi:uncharacterized protein (DUF885 family)